MIFVGTCGFCESMKNYFQDFNTVEIQNTFYKLPRIETLKKWRRLSPQNFVFNFKVFQGITHPATSPTWKRSNVDVKKLRKVGFLNPSKEVFRFWKKMLEYQKILDARVLIVQLPKSFRDTEENIDNAEKFFSSIERGDFEIGIELRGWKGKNIERLCRKYSLIDVTDPLVRLPLSKMSVSYFRLHGSYKNGKIDYKHDYTKKELQKIRRILRSLSSNEIYLMFNNVYMKKNSKEMKKILRIRI